MYSNPPPPDTLIPTVDNTRVHPPTWESPVSDPASLPATRVHLPTWASPVSVPACRIHNLPSPSPPVPTAWHSLLHSSSSYPPARFLTGWSEFISLSPLGATKPPSCTLHICNLFPLHTLQIVGVAPPTMPQLPTVSLCRSFWTVLPQPTTLLPPQVSPTSRLQDAALASLLSVEGTQCASLPSYSPLLSKVPTSPTHTVGLPAPPIYRTLPTPWVLPLPVRSLCPVSLRPTLLVWCSYAYPDNRHLFCLGAFPDTGTSSHSPPSPLHLPPPDWTPFTHTSLPSPHLSVRVLSLSPYDTFPIACV